MLILFKNFVRMELVISLTAKMITVLIIMMTSFAMYLKYKLRFWSKRGVSCLPTTIPFGHITDQILQRKSIGQVVEDNYVKMKKTGVKYAGFYAFTKPSLIIVSPELVKTIMTKEFQSFHDRSSFTDEKNEPLSGHLFALKGAKWRYLRTKLTPTFTSGKMKMMFETLLVTVQQLDEAIQTQIDTAQPIEIKDFLARFTTDVIGSCAFGLDCNSLKDPNAEFRRYGKLIFEVNFIDILRRTMVSISPRLFTFLKLPLFKPAIHTFFMKAARDIVDYRENNHIERNDFMNLLIKLKNNQSIADDHQDNSDKVINDTELTPGLTINQIAAQCFIFFIAGFETSSSTMAFCLYELSVHSDIQENVRKEIVHVLNKYHGNITYEAIMDMHYLDKVIKETLRKYPILPILNRKCVKTFQVPGSDLIIEEGIDIIIPVLGLHRDPDYYPDPMNFDPERFNEEENAKRHTYTYLPFGEGPRNCIGMRFGLMQTKVGLATLIKNYTFTLNKNTIEPLEINPVYFVLSTKDKIWLDARKISI